jgi:signal transduction histidine kinase/ligand-binding sensor domain-containing protein
MRAWIGLALVALATAPLSLSAQDRLVRRFGGESGLIPPVAALAQDSVGFIWVGTRAGLFRYDGARFQRWAPDVLPSGVGALAVSPDGRVVVVDADGRILELTQDGAEELPGTARRSPEYADIVGFDTTGRLWVIMLDGRVAWREGAGPWRSLPSGVLPGDTARKLFPGGGGEVLVAGAHGLWAMAPESAPRRVLDGEWVVDARASPDGTVIAASAGAEIFRIPPGRAPESLTAGAGIPGTRAISLADRNGTMWLATDRYLIAVGPDGAVDLMGPDDGVMGGGPLLVDHEGSLWHAGFTALSQYPEPLTAFWDHRHGLPSAHTRYLGRSGDAVWVTTWQGPGFLRRYDGRWVGGAVGEWHAQGLPCPDGAGGLWLATNRGLQHLRGRGAEVVREDFVSGFGSCSPSSRGGSWLASATGLFHLSKDGRSVDPVESFPYEGGRRVQVVLEDRAGRLWAGSYERICHARVEGLRSGDDAHWSCESLPPGTVHLNSLAELPSGTLWAAGHTVGVLGYLDGRWQSLADNATLPARTVLNLVPSPRGGIWLVGSGILRRVEERAGGTGWTVLERPGAWHGLPAVGGTHVLEEDDGTLWVASSQGVIRIPASVRTAEPIPPRMALVEGRVDGQPVSLDRPVVLPAARNRLELRFAALSFRDPARIRYQVRLGPGEDWSDTNGQPFFSWVDLPAGEHRPQVRASLVDGAWSVRPAELRFRVLPRWYRTPWAVALFAIALGAALFALFRARLAYLVGLERQRTRIAMDLHDEMGSGLASIGILAGVLSANGNEANGPGSIADEVAATAEELGTALSDIVWALDPHRATLEELAARLAEHGGRLFADDVRFDTRFPDRWPPEPLPLPVLRNVLLIGLEALHNAARHAGAESVVLSLQPDGRGWVLTLRDDGAGLPPRHADSARGRGLRAMRRRAADVGGDIRWESRPGEGTTVVLRFELAPRRWRLFGWLRPPGRRPHEHASALPHRVEHP